MITYVLFLDINQSALINIHIELTLKMYDSNNKQFNSLMYSIILCFLALGNVNEKIH